MPMSSDSTASSSNLSPIRVTINPQCSAYFAGEPVNVHLTFTNTRSSGVESPGSSFYPTHRRASHSVSSAPISRPPTSPGTPKLASPISSIFPQRGVHDIQRKGVVGTRHKGKSLSTDTRLEPVGHTLISTGLILTSSSLAKTDSVVNLAAIISPSPRTPRLATIHPAHPHARKQSVDVSNASPDPSVTTIHSLFSSSLESIAESETHAQKHDRQDLSTTYLKPSTYTSISARPFKPPRRASLPGLGTPSSIGPLPISRTSLSLSQSTPGTELLIYGYVQLRGSISFDTSIRVAALQEKFQNSKVLGGGSMDMSVLSDLRTGAFPRLNPQKQSSASIWSNVMGSHKLINPTSKFENEILIFEVQPSPLFIDLNLSAGESKSYSYTVHLPPTLPPTFKGKLFKIDYYLSLGISRAKSPLDRSPVSRHVSQVMKLPLRIYSNVRGNSVDIPPQPYDLLLPLASQDQFNGLITVHEITPAPSLNGVPFFEKSDALDPDLYALKTDARALAGTWRSEMSDGPSSAMKPSVEAESIYKDCREAVEILTRISKNTTYAVQKEDLHVATLTFVKTAYRLGESVLGVISINDLNAPCYHVLKLSAFLEACEKITSFDMESPVTLPPARSITKPYAEYHSSLLNNTTRLSFTLSIPSDASPGFEMYDSSSSASLPTGLEWKVKLYFLIATPGSNKSPGGRSKLRNRTRALVRSGRHTEWGFTYTASDSGVPLERLRASSCDSDAAKPGWMSYFTPTFLTTTSEPRYHDGDEDMDSLKDPKGDKSGDENDSDEDDHRRKWKGKGREGVIEPDGLGNDAEWRGMVLETVECEVPIKVWPGNTAFRPAQVVFEV